MFSKQTFGVSMQPTRILSCRISFLQWYSVHDFDRKCLLRMKALPQFVLLMVEALFSGRMKLEMMMQSRFWRYTSFESVWSLFFLIPFRRLLELKKNGKMLTAKLAQSSSMAKWPSTWYFACIRLNFRLRLLYSNPIDFLYFASILLFTSCIILQRKLNEERAKQEEEYRQKILAQQVGAIQVLTSWGVSFDSNKDCTLQVDIEDEDDEEEEEKEVFDLIMFFVHVARNT